MASEANSVRYQDPIFNLKLSELNRMIVKDKKLLRVTGNIDLNNTHPLLIYNDKKEILLYSLEDFAGSNKENNRFLMSKNFEFEDVSNYSFDLDEENRARFECLIDLSCLEEFNLTDIHPQHDLVQFIGFKDAESIESRCCRFRALFFRVIKRTSLCKYYYALDFQNNFISSKIQ
jgi:hypothetical protein